MSYIDFDPSITGLYIDFFLKSLIAFLFFVYITRKIKEPKLKSNLHALWLVGFTTVFVFTICPVATHLIDSSRSFINSVALITFIVPPSIELDSMLVNQPIQSVLSPLLMVYFGILIFLLVKLFFTLQQLIITRKRVEYADPNSEEKQLLEKLRRLMGISRNVELAYSRNLSVPCSFGCLNPIVLLPDLAKNWEKSLFENVLLHELGHISRFDWIISQLTHFLAILTWFNPFIWICRNRVLEAAEYKCDELVLTSSNHRDDYPTQLLSLTRACINMKEPVATAQQMVNTGELTSRIDHILSFDSNNCPNSPITTIRSAILGLLIIATLMSVRIIALEDQSVIEEPVLLYAEPPEYPEAVYNRLAGRRAWYQFDIDETGNVVPRSIYPLMLTGKKEYDYATFQALLRFKFVPKKIRGQPIRSRGNQYMFEVQANEISML